MKQPIFVVMIWNHAIETTIQTCLFRVPSCSHGVFLMISDYISLIFSVVGQWLIPSIGQNNTWHLGFLASWFLGSLALLWVHLGGMFKMLNLCLSVHFFIRKPQASFKNKNTKPEPKPKRTLNSKLFQNVVFHVPPIFLLVVMFFSKHHLHQKAMRLKVRSRLARCAALGGIKSCATGASLQAPSCLNGLCCWLKPSEVVEHRLKFFHWHSTHEGSMGLVYLP